VLGAGSIGGGALGGKVVDFDDLGGDIGGLGTRVLAGAIPRDIPVEVRTNGTPMVDWRVMQRWGINQSLLPKNTVIRNQPPSLWKEHKKFIVTATAILLAQALTIAGLLLQRSLRRKAELAARENQAARALLAAIVESSEDAIIRKDLTGKIVTWNSGAERLFGYSAAEAIGKPISVIIPPALLSEEERILDRIKRGQPIHFYETVRMREDGTPVEVSLAISPIKDEEGNIIGASKICRDITGRRRAEAEIQRQHTELAHVTRVSTMGQLSSALAHELNQPLGAILRNAEAAEVFLQNESPDLDEVRAILADIRKDDQRAGTVIDRMRTLLKRRSLESSCLDLRELLEDTVALARPDALARKVELKLELPARLPVVRGDRVHLQQVVLNLILNGMDAMNGSLHAPRLLTIRAANSNGASAEISVSDCGIGIEPEATSRIFEPFFTTKANGMGMGLAISRTIIEAHGGRIWAENNAVRGATFTFRLPADKEETVDALANSVPSIQTSTSVSVDS
jgi:PAS domain S-box-containing protein